MFLDRRIARSLLSDVLIRHAHLEGYTHDLAAKLLTDYVHAYTERMQFAVRFRIVADERGTGPITWEAHYMSALNALEQLAIMGGERLRFLSDGGIEFGPDPRDGWAVGIIPNFGR